MAIKPFRKSVIEKITNRDSKKLFKRGAKDRDALAKKAGVTSIVFDRGGFRYTGRVKALADAAREGGLQF